MYNLQAGMYVLVRYGSMVGLEGQVINASNPYGIVVRVLFKYSPTPTCIPYLPGEHILIDHIDLKKHPDSQDIIEARLAVENL